MRLKSVELQNIKNIDEFSQEFSGGVYLIKGDNEEGKTTLLTTIMSILTGERSDNMLKQGKEKGYIKGIVGDRYEVKLSFTKKNPRGTLSITDNSTGFSKKDGAKTMLQHLFEYTDFDASEFVKWSETAEGRRKQVKEVMSLLPEEVQAKINEMELKKSKNKEIASEARRTIKDREGQIKGFNLTDEDLKREYIDVSDLKKQREELKDKLNQEYLDQKKKNEKIQEKHNEKIHKLRENVQVHNLNVEKDINRLNQVKAKLNEIASINDDLVFSKINKEKLIDIRKNIEEASNEIPGKRNYVEEMKEFPDPNLPDPMPDRLEIDKIDAKIEEAHNNNLVVENVKQHRLLWNELEEAKTELNNAEAQNKALEEKKKSLIANSNLPIEGLTFNEDGLFLNDIPVKPGEISTSQEMELAFTLATLKNNKVKVFKIAQGESIGPKRLEKLVKLAEQKGFQGFIERVTDSSLTVEQYYEKGTEPDRQG